MISWIQVINAIEGFAQAHLQIRKYGAEALEQLDQIATRDELYPLLFLHPIDQVSQRDCVEVSFGAVCIDRLNKNRDNSNVLKSDCALILHDLTRWLDDNFEVNYGNVVEFRNNDTVDYCAGAEVRITLVIEKVADCEIPFFGSPFPPPVTCDDGFAVNSDNTFSLTVPSGTTQPIPDSVVTLQNAVGNIQEVVNLPATSLLTLISLGAAIGNSDGSYNTIVPSGLSLAVPDSQINVNGVGEGNVVSVKTIDVQLTDGTNPITPTSTDLTGNTLTIEVEATEVWWERPAGWLPMPTITALDNKFAGLYAVFEDGFNAVAILLNLGTHTIDWGDGATDSGSGANQTYNHVYDYATVTGAVLVSDDGRNYKQVMVEVGYEDITSNLKITVQTTPSIGTINRVQNWLDVSLSTTKLTGFNVSLSNDTGGGLNSIYLQRIKMLGLVDVPIVLNARSLRVLDYDFSSVPAQISFRMSGLGDFRRNKQGDLIDFNGGDVNMRNALGGGLMTKVGHIRGNQLQSVISGCLSLNEVGNIEGVTATTMRQAFQTDRALKKIGTIESSVLNTDIQQMFQDCNDIGEIIFIGTLAGVTITTNAFLNTFSLRRLILPNITIGFDIRASQITGTNLQDLFTSLGTASGAQTITLPTFTTGEDTTIATGKGFTIAYA